MAKYKILINNTVINIYRLKRAAFELCNVELKENLKETCLSLILCAKTMLHWIVLIEFESVIIVASLVEKYIRLKKRKCYGTYSRVEDDILDQKY